MITYHITRYDASTVDCRVLEEGKLPYQLPHIVRHSPTGFNCGYLGSGPADLALSILTDYLEKDPQSKQSCGQVLELHQQFKRDIISGIVLNDNESHDLTGEQIGHWVANGV